MGYARGLATAVIKKEIQLNKLALLPDEEVRNKLIQIKGIGNWTIDVYLMHALQRSDLFPLGDIALGKQFERSKATAKRYF